MIQAIIGKKLTQSQTFSETGKRIPVTSILAGPCVVVSVKTKEKDGYQAIQLGFGKRTPIHVNKPLDGLVKKSGLAYAPRFLKEIRLDEDQVPDQDLKPGFEIRISDVFKTGDKIEVVGISKGKGFQGGVKRYHFKGGPRTHGQSDRERAPGSIGQTTTPGRVFKGKRMAGRMGNDTVMIKNLKIVAIDGEHNLLTISGLVPGAKTGLLLIRKMSA